MLGRLLLCVLIVGVAFPACGGASSSGNPVVATCASVAPPAMLYPAPSASGLPDGNFAVGVGYPQNPSANFNAPSLAAPGEPTLEGTSWLTPSPGPSNPPGFGGLPTGDQYWASAIPALAPKTTYTVSVTSAGCGPATLGTFTTQ